MDRELTKINGDLKAHAEELARFNRAAVNRELRIIELKAEVNELRRRLGEGQRYSLDGEQTAAEMPQAVRPAGNNEE